MNFKPGGLDLLYAKAHANGPQTVADYGLAACVAAPVPNNAGADHLPVPQRQL